ncbi:putative transcription factor interactor and regulator CCHC(Zn) family [Helianthus annuus]|nr:putative transcription factor interactor and regulator CCHC(Zn) family [Helianthus annuus]
MSNMANLNAPKMMKVENYLTWKNSFKSFIESQDARMWICIEDGYVNPIHDFEGRPRRTDYVNMKADDKKTYDAEKRALAAIKTSLPDSIKHTFTKYTNSKDMWDALQKRYQGIESVTQAFMAEIVSVDEAETSVSDAESQVENAEKKVDAEVEKESEAEKVDAEVEKESAAEKVVADQTTKVYENENEAEQVSAESNSVCLRCRELQGEVDRLTTQNKSLVSEMSSIKESNFFAKRNESLYLKKIKGHESEIEALTCKLNEKLQVIDLAHEMMAEKTKEISEKCKELSDAQLKIIELEQKLSQLRDSSFVMKHMMGGLKKSNDKTTVGFQGFNEVPPPLSHDYSFLPDEHELAAYMSTAPSSFGSTSSQGEGSESDDAKKNNNREFLKKKNSPPKSKNQTFVKKINFVQGSDMKNETAVIEKESNVEFAKNKNKEKSEIKQTEQNSSKASPPSDKGSTSETPAKKSLKRRSCFRCHVKGHVASCCPNKKSEAQMTKKQRGKLPVKSGDSEEKGSNSPMKSAPKQPENVAVGVDKAETGTPQVPRFQRNQQRFQPRSPPGRYQRPRSSSPRMNNYNSNNFRSQGQYQNRYQNNGGRNFYNNGFRNYNNNASWNQNQNFQRSNCPNVYRNPQDQRPSGNQNQIPTGLRSKTPVRSNGYWMDVPVVGEFGRPKSIKAWVPQSN